jgi:hypothetical protein
VDRAMRWQKLRQEAAKWAKILDCEPYAAARRAFDQEYVRRLAERCGGEGNAMSERSGLSPDAVAEMQRAQEAHEK